MALLQAGAGVASWSVLSIVIAIIVVVGVIAVLYVFFDWMGYKPPPQLVKLFWIVVAVVVCILAVKLIWGMM